MNRFIVIWVCLFSTFLISCGDDVVIENEVPSCPKASDLDPGFATSNTVDLAWGFTGTGVTLNPGFWEVEYGTLGFTKGSGTVIISPNSTATLNNLTPNTQYDYYVRANCGSTTYGDWAGPQSFTTN